VILGVFKPERTKEITTMALDKSALSDLADALRSVDGMDLVREAVRIVFQELIEAEAAESIGAGL
jgi:putative transposase